MKTVPPPCPTPETGPKYWRSLDQLAETPEFKEWAQREFPAGASELTDPVTRRSFVKIMSASFLLAGGFGLAGCRRPVENIYPFSKMPEGYVHGVAKFYATSMPTRGTAVPLLAKSNDGRPTKLEGNPQHPISNGGTDRYVQASILNLYDADRAQRFAENGNNATSAKAFDTLKEIADWAQKNSGQGLSFLAERSSSPSRDRLQGIIAQKFPKAKWHVYEPVDFDIHRQAASVATGKSVNPFFKIEAAKVILSLDADFIGGEENAFVSINQFAKNRKTETSKDDMNRLYAVEGLMTLTGVNADHRLRVPGSAVINVAASVAQEILRQAGGNVDAAIGQLADEKKLQVIAEQNKPTLSDTPTTEELDFQKRWSPDWISKWAKGCAADLLKNKGAGLVLAGHRQPLAVHLIAYAINSALGNLNKTIVFQDIQEPQSGSIVDLAKDLNAGQVETLVVLGGNPVYNAPAELDWAKAQSKAKTVVRLAYYEDESFPTNGWALPMAHYLESWGDARTADGTIVSVQPLISPLFDGLTEIEVLARIAGEQTVSSYDIVRDTFRGIAGGDEEQWKKFVHDGFLDKSAAKTVEVQLDSGAVSKGLASVVSSAVPDKDKFEVVFHRDYRVDDGRLNNNGWMQELPDPVTKITWENTILLSPATARSLNISVENRENNRLMVPMVKIQLDGREIEGPVWVQPGQANNVIGLALGYGRTKSGRVGTGTGYNAYALRTTQSGDIAVGAKLTLTGQRHHLAITQDHGTMEGRPIIREGTLAEYRENGNFASEMDMEIPSPLKSFVESREAEGEKKPGARSSADNREDLSLYPNPLKEAEKKAHHQWGMSIDLSSCVGCSTCMVACQSENNVPIVGKMQVANNREMHWLRIDRYFTGPKDEPQVVNQPMLCQHCEAAPCENVCPVNATVHDQEGLNVMVYNRCVGTRYCSNNCPYKVRRFNFFDYNRRTLEQLKGPVYSTPILSSTDGEWDLMRWWKNPDGGNLPQEQWELLKLVKNPDVTVRMRGVMEKCTFCVQRIEGAKIAQKVKAGASGDVKVPRDTIKTACQQACPADAIVFGDISDPESRVSKLKRQDRDYTVLDFLNTRPRLTYLARLRNPNPEMPDAYKLPLSTQEFKDKHHDGEVGPEGQHKATPGEKKGEA
ncbi:TAT-variant-translocated molybdopterin oxidoreductase [Pedosphaera parvula]|uniref:Fe-S-cluster-containing hydrogenase components 1-like protein n=1 Tax=Pedosphaera parvula (strain Ellin514) TaxID=320771 RepID=B9XE43_PEDPL|nr:TAT-variant-translocated molybdopterin oxidoreductase [Pedosphaera parvula]EEF61934.1 Fe-S-cluster-containing hydrogenase components 1-like protein [Pedosphaera parvula Ellin514]